MFITLFFLTMLAHSSLVARSSFTGLDGDEFLQNRPIRKQERLQLAKSQFSFEADLDPEKVRPSSNPKPFNFSSPLVKKQILAFPSSLNYQGQKQTLHPKLQQRVTVVEGLLKTSEVLVNQIIRHLKTGQSHNQLLAAWNSDTHTAETGLRRLHMSIPSLMYSVLDKDLSALKKAPLLFNSEDKIRNLALALSSSLSPVYVN